MRKITFFYNTGYCSSYAVECVEFDDSVTDKDLDAYAYEGALINAESYGYYPPGYEDNEDDESVSDNIEGSWEEYDAEKHDMLKPSSGKWFE